MEVPPNRRFLWGKIAEMDDDWGYPYFRKPACMKLDMKINHDSLTCSAIRGILGDPGYPYTSFGCRRLPLFCGSNQPTLRWILAIDIHQPGLAEAPKEMKKITLPSDSSSTLASFPLENQTSSSNPRKKMKSVWWLGHPSEKYESQLGWLFPIYWKIKNVPNHQPAEDWNWFTRDEIPLQTQLVDGWSSKKQPLPSAFRPAAPLSFRTVVSPLPRRLLLSPRSAGTVAPAVPKTLVPRRFCVHALSGSSCNTSLGLGGGLFLL